MAFLCYQPRNMVKATDLPEVVFWRIARIAAGVALAAEETVTITGAVPGAAVFCRMSCQFRHPGSVVLIPDLVLAELIANGFDETPTAVLKLADGRSVHAYRTDDAVVQRL